MGRVEMSRLWDVTHPLFSSSCFGPLWVWGLVPYGQLLVEIPGTLNSSPILPGVACGRKGPRSTQNPQQKGHQRWWGLTEVLVSRSSGEHILSSEHFFF